jgi:hypothetical protein
VYRFAIVLIGLLMLAGQVLARDARPLASTTAKVAKGIHPGLPNPANLTSMPAIPAYIVGMPWCFATATMMATIVLNRELKTSETWQIFGSCVVPFLGGLAMQELFKKHPEWDMLPPTSKVDRFGIGGQ